MSQSAGPFDYTPENMMKPMSEMQSWMFDMARSSPAARVMPPLMAHPTAAAAAATAIGMGAASQMMGFFMGSMQGAMDASRRMGVPFGTLDMTAGLKAFDTEWMARFGDAALETAEEAGRTVGDVAQRVAAEVEKDIAEAPAKSAHLAKKSEEAAAAMVAATADALEKTTRTVAKQAGAAAGKAEHVAKRAMTEPARTAAKAATAADAVAAPAAKSVGKVVARSAPVAKSEPAAKTAPGAKSEPVAKSAPTTESKSPAKTSETAKTVEAGKSGMTAPRKMAKPDAPDDLKRISGVGPKLEEVLNRLGVWSFAQIAEWTPAEVAWVDDYLQFRGRIERDDWIGQASGFAGRK